MYENLVRALRCTGNGIEEDTAGCANRKCKYRDVDGACNLTSMCEDAADVIDSLRKQLARVKAERDRLLDRTHEAQVERDCARAERDAAIKYIPHDCETCMHWRPRTDNPCAAPGKAPCEYRKRQTWEWRGPQKEDA